MPEWQHSWTLNLEAMADKSAQVALNTLENMLTYHSVREGSSP